MTASLIDQAADYAQRFGVSESMAVGMLLELWNEAEPRPRIGEAYRHFTGQQLDKAHRAIVDVQACMAIFFAMQDAPAAKAAA